jgi:Transposase DDE domain
VAGQDVEPGERPGSWRIARKVAKDRVISTVDPQARHARKTSAHKRDGYKGHVAAEPESGLVTECALTAAAAPTGPPGSGCWALSSRALRCSGIRPTAVGRPARRCEPPATSRRSSRSHSRAPGGFTIHDFRIDRHGGMVRCPAGVTAPITSSGRISFARECPSCPLRRRCTTARQGRILHLHPHEDELRAARRRAMTRSFQHSYRRWRPMVSGVKG